MGDQEQGAERARSRERRRSAGEESSSSGSEEEATPVFQMPPGTTVKPHLTRWYNERFIRV